MCWASSLTRFPSWLVFITILCWSFLYFWEFSFFHNFLCFLPNCSICQNVPLHLKSPRHYPNSLHFLQDRSPVPTPPWSCIRLTVVYNIIFFWIPQVLSLNHIMNFQHHAGLQYSVVESCLLPCSFHVTVMCLKAGPCLLLLCVAA